MKTVVDRNRLISSFDRCRVGNQTVQLVAVFICLSLPTFGQQYESDGDVQVTPGWQLMILDAVQLHVPEDWVVFDERTTSEAVGEMQREFEVLRNVDMSMIQAMATSPVLDEFSENVNISPMPGVVDINDVGLQEYLAMVTSQLDGIGYEVELLSSRVDRIAGIECYSVEIHSRFQNVDIYQLQYVVPGIDATYAITYSSGMIDRARLQPLFEESIETLRVTGREYNAIERVIPAASSIQENAMFYGVLAAVGGLAVALIALGLKRD